MSGADIQETLFFPLLGRARAARAWPTCFRGPWSERIVSLAAATRPGIRDRDMGKMPAAIYALDFPEVLRLRRTWMGARERERELPFCLTDHHWMDEVDASDGLIDVTSGIFYFLDAARVGALVDAMARRFPGGRLVYDAESPELVAKSEQAVRDRGLDAVPTPFRVVDPYAPRSWSRPEAQCHEDEGRSLRAAQLERGRRPGRGQLRPVLLRPRPHCAPAVGVPRLRRHEGGPGSLRGGRRLRRLIPRILPAGPTGRRFAGLASHRNRRLPHRRGRGRPTRRAWTRSPGRRRGRVTNLADLCMECNPALGA